MSCPQDRALTETLEIITPGVAPDYELRLDDDASYLNLLSRKIFHAGFSRDAVNQRWGAFETAFLGFEPHRVAALDADDMVAITYAPGIIRNRRKLKAVFDNARAIVRIAAEHGSFRAWLRALAGQPYEVRADTLGAALHNVGPSTAFWFLFEAGLAELSERPEYVALPKARS